MCHFWGPKMTHSHNSGSALRIFKKFLQNERGMNILLLIFREKKFTVRLGMVKLSQATANWILKQSGHD